MKRKIKVLISWSVTMQLSVPLLLHMQKSDFFMMKLKQASLKGNICNLQFSGITLISYQMSLAVYKGKI